MKIIPVNSSNIIAVGYDPGTMVLTVQFKGDSWYEYLDVAWLNVLEFIFAESPGRYLNDTIKPYYECRQLDHGPADAHV